MDITEAQTEQGFYLPVQRVCRPNHTFRGFQGQIESGEISVGDTVTVQPGGEQAAVKSILIGDKQAEYASAGQPVTIQLDREIDVSRGRVLTKDSGITCAKAFQASLLWMDDSPLTEGREYFVRVGTRTIPGVIQSIRYKTDVNTGEQLEAFSLKKNEIAYCDIVVDESIPLDAFERHKALGEVLLIDRITNMTSACGVIQSIVKDSDVGRLVQFTSSDLTAKTHLFETVFFQLDSGLLGRYDPDGVQFSIGDSVPLRGEGYNYPEDFDILSLQDGLVVRIRNGIFAQLLPLEQFITSGLPMVNERGAAICVRSQAELEEFIQVYRTHAATEQRKLNKWLHFETFRRIVYRGTDADGYVI